MSKRMGDVTRRSAKVPARAWGLTVLSRIAPVGVLHRMCHVALLALLLCAAGLRAGALATPHPCPSTPDHPALAHGPVTCSCSPEAAAVGAVWGEDTYMEDSSTCRAAVHAGVIGVEGGTVTVLQGVDPTTYRGSSRNGVESGGWSGGPSSFQFAPPGGLPLALIAASADRCPTKLPPDPDLTRLTCTCPAGSGRSVEHVWGTLVYTTDSPLCAAALHAGAIGPGGGPVTLLTGPGMDAYQGSVRNGVTSRDAAHWHASFRFLEAAALGTDACRRVVPSAAQRDALACANDDAAALSVRAGRAGTRAEGAATCLPPCTRTK